MHFFSFSNVKNDYVRSVPASQKGQQLRRMRVEELNRSWKERLCTGAQAGNTDHTQPTTLPVPASPTTTKKNLFLFSSEPAIFKNSISEFILADWLQSNWHHCFHHKNVFHNLNYGKLNFFNRKLRRVNN